MPLPQTGSGIEVLVYSDEGTAGRLAQNISAELSAVGWTDLGVKERPGLIVLRKTRLDTLAFDYILPTTRRIPDLHRLETCAAGRTIKKCSRHKIYAAAATFLVHMILLSVSCQQGDSANSRQNTHDHKYIHAFCVSSGHRHGKHC